MTRVLTTLLILLFSINAWAIDDDEPLAPEKAFKFSADVTGPNSINIIYDIADGYYLYKKNFSFKTDDERAIITDVQLPDGKIKHDEFFGEVEIYRKQVTIPLTLDFTLDGDIEDFTLLATSQGCADMGICYPPQTENYRLPAPLKLSATSIAVPNLLDTLNAQLRADVGDPELLPPNEAFQYSFEIIDRDNLMVTFLIADGYYLYKDKLQFSLINDIGYSIENVALPKGKIKDDEFFGRIEVYTEDIQFPVKLKREKDDSTDFEFVAEYQGCAEIGVCFPPIRKEAVVQMDRLEIPNSPLDSTDLTKGTPNNADNTELSEQDALAQRLKDGSIISSILLFFIAGVGLAFTPCVFPMIPILSGIIVGQGDGVDTKKAFTLSAIYVLSMAIVFALAGVVAALAGANLQILFQDPILLSIFAALFVALAFSMFGFYELQMPNGIQSRLTEWSNSQEGGSYTGAGIMGALSALIVGPCVTPPLIAALIYISQTQDPWLGGFALFALAMGMGVPLVVIGTSAGKLLPRAGGWMDNVKAVFGVMMLALAIWMLERFLPISVIMALAALLLLVSGIYMGAFEPIKEGQSGWAKLWKGLGLALVLYGAVMLIGAASGSKSLLTPLTGLNTGSSNAAVAEKKLNFQYVKGVDGLNQALQTAKTNNQQVMLDFYADWCVSCKEMEAFTFSDANVQSRLSNTLLLKTDVTANDQLDKALLSEFGLFGPPAILFFDPQAGELRQYRIVGFKSADEFLAHLNKVLS